MTTLREQLAEIIEQEVVDRAVERILELIDGTVEPCSRCGKILRPSNCATQGNYALIVCPCCYERVEYKGD